MAAPKPLSRVAVGDAVLEYLEALERRVDRGEMSGHTLTAYRRDLAEFTDLVGADRILDDVEPDDLETALHRFATTPDRRYSRSQKIGPNGQIPPGRGPHARARWVISLRGLFGWAARHGYIQVDPTRDLANPRTPRRARGARLGLPLDQALTLRDTPTSRPVGPARPVDRVLDRRDETILRLLGESGPRVSEVCAANRDDLRLHEETGRPVLRVHGKGNKIRDLPLSPALADTLTGYLTGPRPTPPATDPPARQKDATRALFVTVRGRRMTPRDVQRMVERRARAAGVTRVTPHGLRHTALTVLARSGVDIATVAQIAGHENIGTTSIYLDHSMRAAQRAVDHSPMAGPAGPAR